MNPVNTTADLDEARRQERAVNFLWVNWAIQARHSEKALHQFLRSWRMKQSNCVLSSYRADVSDQEGELWLAVREWLRSEGQPVDPLTYGGNGALLWVKFGTIIASVPYVAICDREKLMAVTHNIFECSN